MQVCQTKYTWCGCKDKFPSDHSFYCSLSFILYVQMPFLRSFYLLDWCACVCDWAQRASIHQVELVSQETHNSVCWEGGREMVEGADGWMGWCDRGVACRARSGKGKGGCCRVMRGVVRGEMQRGWQQSEAKPGGWHGSGASLCPGPFCGQHLQPALHAKHTLQRGRLHMGLRGPEEKHSWGSAERRGRGSLQQPLSSTVSPRWSHGGML